ncbi:MAG: hypothetical protein IK115_10110 [Lachnospiraceae bacterium]|nr:hypothetical protein [Lachnospiraceae bacterium]
MKQFFRNYTGRISAVLTLIMLLSYIGAAYSLSTQAADVSGNAAQSANVAESANGAESKNAAESGNTASGSGNVAAESDNATATPSGKTVSSGSTVTPTGKAVPEEKEADMEEPGIEGSDDITPDPQDAAVPEKLDAAGNVNYSTVLKRARNFGITAAYLHNHGHMETTFAVKEYNNGSENNDVDFINGTAQFIIGSLSSGSHKITFGPAHYDNEGESHAVDTFNIETTPEVAAGYQSPYTKKGDGSFIDAAGECGNFSFQTAFFRDRNAGIPAVEISQRSKSAIDNNIDGIIENADERSVEFSGKAAGANSAKYALKYDDYVEKGADGKWKDDKCYLDLKKDVFKGKVVYINVDDKLAKCIAKTGDLRITKYSSTIIVFNVEAGVTNNGSAFHVDKCCVTAVDDADPTKKIEVTSHTDVNGQMNGEANNTAVDAEICQKLIWNIRSAGNVELNIASGTFLAPYANTVTVTGSASGWLVAGGKVELKCQWHYIYQGSSENVRTNGVDEINFSLRKAFTESYTTRNAANKLIEDSGVPSAEGDFTFDWYATDADYNTAGKTAVKCKNYATGMVDFPVLKYNAATDKNKTFHYVIRESETKNEKASALSTGYFAIDVQVVEAVDGLDYKVSYKYFLRSTDANPYKSVTDPFIVSGPTVDLGAFYNLTTEEEPATPTPTPTPSGNSVASANFVISKVLTDKASGSAKSPAGFKVRFTRIIDGNPGTTDYKVFTERGSSKITIKVKSAGVYRYEMAEVNDGLPGIEYDAKVYDVVITATLAENGVDLNPVADVKITERESGAVVTGGEVIFRNSYSPESVKVAIEAEKQYNGDLSSGRFEFILTRLDGSGNPVSTHTATNVGSKISFEQEFTEAGTYRYTLEEKAGDRDDITYDTKKYELSVIVKDMGTGKLTASISSNVAKPVFTNTLQNAGDKKFFGIEVKKHMSGDWTDSDLKGGEFSFTLDFRGKKYTAVNEAGGTVRFTDIPLPAAAGDYAFTVSETGAAADLETESDGHLTLDTAKLNGTVTVADAADPVISFADGKNSFTNNFVYNNGRFYVSVNKVVETADGASLGGAKMVFTRDTDDFDLRDSRVRVTQGGQPARDLDVSRRAIRFTTVSGNLTVITGIPSGSYTLTEIEAPEGYKLSRPVHFTVDADGKVTSSGEVRGATVVMIDDPYPATPTPTPSPTVKPTPTKKATVTPTPTKKVTPTPTKKGSPTPTKKVSVTPTGKTSGTPTVVTRGSGTTRGERDSSPKTGDRKNPAGILAAVGSMCLLALLGINLMEKKRKDETK